MMTFPQRREFQKFKLLASFTSRLPEELKTRIDPHLEL